LDRRSTAAEREYLLRRSQAIAHVGSWRFDVATGAVVWSDELFRIAGFASARGQPTFEEARAVVHPEDRELVQAELRAALGGRGSYDIVHRLVRPDGSLRWVRDKAEGVFDARGRVTGLVGILQDVTEQKRREDVLAARVRLLQRDEEEPLEHLLRATLDEAEALTDSTIGFLHFVDRDEQALTLQTWSSNTLARMCTAEGAGKHYPIAHAGVWVDCVAARRAVVHNDYANLPHKRGLPAGHAPVVRELVVPVLRGNRVCSILGVGNKATNYHDADVEAVSLLADLAWDIAERKRAREESKLLERRLQQAQKLESLGVLAGGIAHDFNNLLLTIAGNVENAAAEADAEVRGLALEQALQSVRRASELTRQMLAYSGRGQFVCEPLDLDGFVRGHVEFFRAVVPRTQHFVCEPTAGQTFVAADPGQLQQVITNLLSNAAEAQAAADAVVTLRTGAGEYDAEALLGSCVDPRPAAGRFGWIEVEDNGVGMDRPTLARLFEPFFTTKFAGRGLGLPAVFGIVRSHGGALFVRSEPGRGTAVRVLFPVSREVIPAPPPAAAEPRESGGKVLVVDDDAGVRGVCAVYLHRLGHEPVLASSGDEAIAIFRRAPSDFAVVLTDLTMPGRDGVETCAAIKAVRGDVPVLLSTGFSDLGTVPDGHSRPDGLLHKPYQLEDLKAALSAVLGRDGPA
jgi:PAS domain S-box-containing protein